MRVCSAPLFSLPHRLEKISLLNQQKKSLTQSIEEIQAGMIAYVFVTMVTCRKLERKPGHSGAPKPTQWTEIGKRERAQDAAKARS